MSIFNEEIKKKAEEMSKSDWIKVKDPEGNLLITKENPFVGRLIEHQYVEASNPRFGNEEGMKHILTWLTKEKGQVVKKRQSTTSWAFIHALAKAVDKGIQDFKFWFEYVQTAGGVKTVCRVVPIQKKEKAPPVVKPEEIPVIEEEEGTLGEPPPEEPPEIDVEDLPF